MGDALYALIFSGAFIEGFNINLIAGFLATQGLLHTYIALVLLITGNWLSDIMWYGLGYRKGRSALEIFIKIFPPIRFILEEEHIIWFISLFRRFGTQAVVSSKFMVGPGIAIQIAAGIARMRFIKYAGMSLVANILFAVFLFWLGFIFGASYEKLALYVQGGSVIFFFIVIILLAQFVVKSQIRKSIKQKSTKWEY